MIPCPQGVSHFSKHHVGPGISEEDNNHLLTSAPNHARGNRHNSLDPAERLIEKHQLLRRRTNSRSIENQSQFERIW
jgi:hypothetical protein